jgi:hypothetical protein
VNAEDLVPVVHRSVNLRTADRQVPYDPSRTRCGRGAAEVDGFEVDLNELRSVATSLEVLARSMCGCSRPGSRRCARRCGLGRTRLLRTAWSAGRECEIAELGLGGSFGARQRRRTSCAASQTPRTGQRMSWIATRTSRPAHAWAVVWMICRPSRSQTIHAVTLIGGLAAICLPLGGMGRVICSEFLGQ